MLNKKRSWWVVLSLCLSACGPSLSKVVAANGASTLDTVGTGSNTGTSGSGNSSASANTSLSSDESAFLVKINALRAQNGLSALRIDPVLQKAARMHSDYMNGNDTLSHDEPAPNTASWDRVANLGGSFSTVGENIACGNQSADGTYQQWVNSSGHLANMLGSGYTAIGIARSGTAAEANNKSCPWYWTTDFGG